MLKPEALGETARNFPGLNLAGIENTVLATIINRKVEDVKKIEPPREPYAGTVRSLAAALQGGSGRHFIMECKQSSPTLGDFCKDFDLDRYIRCYEQHASAISVLCEEHFFKGSLEYLKYVRSRTSLPVLCKDFVICEAQLEQARAAGADAVLLMLSVLTEERFRELYAKARALGLEVLTEVDNETQARFAASLRLPVIGINNRNLRILKIDLNRTLQLLPLLPRESVIISESGICSHGDLLHLKGVKNFLIGSALTGSEDVFFTANSMLYGTNKICGLATTEGLAAAVAAHAAIAGFIFFKKSPRCVSPEHARILMEPWRGRIRFAGVFVNATIEEMTGIATALKLDYLQLHGSESPQLIAELKSRLPRIKIIKALNISSPESFEAAKNYQGCCDLLLLDSKAPGSGSSFAWSQIPNFIDRDKTLLSGGIGLSNLEDALSYGFAGLDLNSRLEISPGVKDPQLIKQAFEIIRSF